MAVADKHRILAPGGNDTRRVHARLRPGRSFLAEIATATVAQQEEKKFQVRSLAAFFISDDEVLQKKLETSCSSSSCHAAPAEPESGRAQVSSPRWANATGDAFLRRGGASMRRGAIRSASGAASVERIPISCYKLGAGPGCPGAGSSGGDAARRKNKRTQ
jgi:hypothetical protein